MQPCSIGTRFFDRRVRVPLWRRVAKSLGLRVRDVRAIDGSEVMLPERASPWLPSTDSRHGGFKITAALSLLADLLVSAHIAAALVSLVLSRSICTAMRQVRPGGDPSLIRAFQVLLANPRELRRTFRTRHFREQLEVFCVALC